MDASGQHPGNGPPESSPIRDTVITVEDLFTLTDLPVSTWDGIRDRAVIIR